MDISKESCVKVVKSFKFEDVQLPMEFIVNGILDQIIEKIEELKK